MARRLVRDGVERDMTPEEEAEFLATLPAPVPLLPMLSARQLRLGLLALGVTGVQVEAALQAIPDGTAREAALIEWRHSTSYDRDHPLIADVGAALGLAEHDIDAAWLAAAGL